MKISPWPKLQEVLPPLRTYEFDELSGSISQYGVLQPLLVLPDGRIIDGHHRWKISNGKAPYKILELGENEAFALGIILNAARRNMSPNVLEDVWNAFDKHKELRKKVVIELLRAGKTQAEVFAITGVPQQTISDWKKEENATNTEIGKGCNSKKRKKHPKKKKKKHLPKSNVKIPKSEYEAVYDRWKAGETQEKIAAEYGVTRQEIAKIIGAVEKKKAEEDAIAEAKVTIKEKNTVLCCDITKVTNYIKPNSIDLILTDPPYAKKFIPIWDSLGELAAKVLKPSGFLVTYCGHITLPNALNSLDKHLEYFWTAALMLRERTQFYQRPVANMWKPILVFYKPPLKLSKMFSDVIIGAGKEKTHHEWQQALNESKILIDAFTNEKDVVMDPLCGSGTSLLAAKQTNRRYLGFDIDEKAVKTTQVRLDENG